MSELTLEAAGYTPEEARVARRIHRLVHERPGRLQPSGVPLADCPQSERPWRPLEYIEPSRQATQKECVS